MGLPVCEWEIPGGLLTPPMIEWCASVREGPCPSGLLRIYRVELKDRSSINSQQVEMEEIGGSLCVTEVTHQAYISLICD